VPAAGVVYATIFEGYTALESSVSPTAAIAVVAAVIVSPATFGTTTVGGCVVVVVGGLAVMRMNAFPPEYVPAGGSVAITISSGASPASSGANPSAVKTWTA